MLLTHASTHTCIYSHACASPWAGAPYSSLSSPPTSPDSPCPSRWADPNPGPDPSPNPDPDPDPNPNPHPRQVVSALQRPAAAGLPFLRRADLGFVRLGELADLAAAVRSLDSDWAHLLRVPPLTSTHVYLLPLTMYSLRTQCAHLLPTYCLLVLAI